MQKQHSNESTIVYNLNKLVGSCLPVGTKANSKVNNIGSNRKACGLCTIWSDTRNEHTDMRAIRTSNRSKSKPYKCCIRLHTPHTVNETSTLTGTKSANRSSFTYKITLTSKEHASTGKTPPMVQKMQIQHNIGILMIKMTLQSCNVTT